MCFLTESMFRNPPTFTFPGMEFLSDPSCLLSSPTGLQACKHFHLIMGGLCAPLTDDVILEVETSHLCAIYVILNRVVAAVSATAHMFSSVSLSIQLSIKLLFVCASDRKWSCRTALAPPSCSHSAPTGEKKRHDLKRRERVRNHCQHVFNGCWGPLSFCLHR